LFATKKEKGEEKKIKDNKGVAASRLCRVSVLQIEALNE